MEHEAMNSLLRWVVNKQGSWARRSQAPANRPLRYLFLQYETSLGTAINAAPLFQALRQLLPDAHITVACAGLPREVLRGNPAINDFVETPHAFQSPVKAIWWFARVMRRRQRDFDCVVIDSGNRRAFTMFLAWMTGVLLRIGFRSEADNFHRALTYDTGSSVIANNLRLLTLMGFDSVPKIEPELFPSGQDRLDAKAWLKSAGIAPRRPLICLVTQTSGAQPTAWFPDRFVELGRKLASEGAQFVFPGTKTEYEKVEWIRAEIDAPSLNAAGKTTVGQLAALVAECDLMVTLDTGTMHVGRSMRVPMVVLASAWQPKHEWLPLEVRTCRILRSERDVCSECTKFSCPTRACMAELTVELVLEATRSQMHGLERQTTGHPGT